MFSDLHPLECGRQRVDAPAQFDDLALEQVNRFDVELAARAERHLLDAVDIGLHQAGHLEVVVHHVVGDGVHHRVRPQPQLLGVGVHPLAHLGQSAVFTVAHRDHEVARRRRP